jgi:hypothetical protein
LLALARGVVRAAEGEGEQQLTVELTDGVHPAIADTALVGVCEVGDEVIVNVVARELGLGSGGFDVVHVNLTRGLGAAQSAAAHVLKLNYTSLQHAVEPVEAGRWEARLPASADGDQGPPVAVLALHAQLAPLAWAFTQHAAGARLGYVQTAGGALPGSHSRTVRDLRARGLLAAQITAGPCYGGADGDALTTAGALVYGFGTLGWDAAVCGPGPGIVGSGSALGHGGLSSLDSAHTALALGATPLIVARMSSADERDEHRGLSHHTRSVLDLLLAEVLVALPEGATLSGGRHEARGHAVDLAGYLDSGLPAEHMGRLASEDPLFFESALAGGGVLAELVSARR